MKKVVLKPVEGPQKPVELKIGKTIIGRGPLLEVRIATITSLLFVRVSREHLPIRRLSRVPVLTLCTCFCLN